MPKTETVNAIELSLKVEEIKKIQELEGFELVQQELRSLKLSDIVEFVEIVEELEEYEHIPFFLYADNVGVSYADYSNFEDQYRGEWDSELEYAENFIDDCYNLDNMMGNLAMYFDYEAFTRDLFISDYYSLEYGYKTFVFSNC